MAQRSPTTRMPVWLLWTMLPEGGAWSEDRAPRSWPSRNFKTAEEMCQMYAGNPTLLDRSFFLPQTIAPHATSNTGAVFRVEKSTGMLFSRGRLLLLLHGRGTYNSHHSEFQFQKFKYRRWFKLRLDWSHNSIKLHMTAPHTTTWKPPVLWNFHLPGSSLNQVVA